MGIGFGREICGDLSSAGRREWLVTNGLGGYASGTVGGLLTRRYHGLLVAALEPPLGRTLLLAKVDESVCYDGRSYPLYTNRWADGTIDPQGYRQIEHFGLEGTVPLWKFACEDALLEKRVWMEQGANTTYIHYRLHRASRPLSLQIKALINYRDYHGLTHGGAWQMRVDPVEQGIRVVPFPEARLFSLLTDHAETLPSHEWHVGFDLPAERDRGLDHHEDHLHAATFQVVLEPGRSLTLVASVEMSPSLDGETALKNRHRYEEERIGQWLAARPAKKGKAPDWINHLVLAADQFIVDRPPAGESDGKTVIAGYPWFGDWGRDTMISLPGLTLSTGRPDVARSILLTFARYVDQGMLPNRFPDAGKAPEYNTADAALWYIEAVRACHAATRDDDLLSRLFPVLTEIIAWHSRGTRYGIHVDPGDGLLHAGEPGLQLTWMDAKVGDWVVTPRTGKPVEINALWYNALRAMAEFARRLGKPGGEHERMGDRVQAGFKRFWNHAAGYCYDLLDGPDGSDPSLRPNQIFAVSLPESPLTPAQQRGVVDACGRELFTSHGLRSLSPSHPGYQGRYEGDPRRRDGAYHQGTVWGWLIGPFALAHLRVYKNPRLAQNLLEPMADQLLDYGVGSVGEIFDGDPPMTPRGCIAQAWTVAEMLRAWTALQEHDAKQWPKERKREPNKKASLTDP